MQPNKCRCPSKVKKVLRSAIKSKTPILSEIRSRLKALIGRFNELTAIKRYPSQSLK